ncbi:unnamed protein product [Tuber melanosporum]|uniref:(Perigord truffle) hypothetical protein n=1 Tax=Tuber melanosporum (strain Mel28) TaxID=656061 RepID=D5GEH2_TUBMM|nr:uncharacterized protein GSTUM_00006483001 [Tuber melanosporum]CAZ82915.1 unnamed protein product [Tuber melanosporum]
MQGDLDRLDSHIVHVSEDGGEDDPLGHLPPEEAEIIRKQLDIPNIDPNYFTLFRFASRNDIIIIVISIIAAVIGGAAMPLMTIIFGQLGGTFQNFILGYITAAKMQSELNRFTLYFVYLGIGEFVTIYIATVGFIYTGEHISQKIREQYLKAILRQNIAFFDKLGAGEITTRITSDTNLIQDGISEKIAITLIMGGGSTFIIKYNKQSIDSYAEGGTVVEEVVSSIRNTTAFNTQDKLAKQYDDHLQVAERWGLRQKSALAVMLGFMMCIVYLNYGLAFWQGSRFLVSGDTNLSAILTVLLAVIIGGNILPWKYFRYYRPNVKHIYPSRPEVPVIHDMSLIVPAGKVTALVGASGSGKSTIVGLVERFYDPVGGSVYLDGHDISQLNLRWLRENISLVSQEPVLFGTTIFKNVCHGLIGTEWENASEEEKRELVTNACIMSNADTFIRSLPEGYDTNVGERGFLMSGGQKQRIAIARAVVSDPKILLLDEATSALDTRSEGVVQAALDKASMGRTTIVIAHRLSTIKTADNIVVMSEGTIVESGTHDELLERRSAYYNLLKLTLSRKSKSHIALENRAPEAKPEYGLWELIKLTASFNSNEKFYMFGLAFAYCSERLVHRVRDRAFRTIMRQDIAYFDREENSTGALTSFLSTETTHLSGMSGVTLGTLLIRRSKKAYEKSAGFACEATAAIRTVASLTREKDRSQEFYSLRWFPIFYSLVRCPWVLVWGYSNQDWRVQHDAILLGFCKYHIWCSICRNHLFVCPRYG